MPASDNQRKVLRKDMRMVFEKLNMMRKKVKGKFLQKLATQKEIGVGLRFLATHVHGIISRHCGTRKQKTKRNSIHHYVFFTDRQLLQCLQSTLSPDILEKTPLLASGIISSRTIPSLIGLLGCTSETACLIKKFFPELHSKHQLDTTKLTVPIFTSILHTLRDRQQAQPEAELKDRVLQEYFWLQQYRTTMKTQQQESRHRKQETIEDDLLH